MHGDTGPRGAIGICPDCNFTSTIVWNPQTDVSTCTNCGWNNSIPTIEDKEEKRLTLEELVKKYDLILWSTANTARGKSYQYMDFNGINVIINEWDKSFQLKWLMPRSIFTIECPPCSPYDYPNHFDRTYKRFQDVVTTYRCGLNYQ